MNAAGDPARPLDLHVWARILRRHRQYGWHAAALAAAGTLIAVFQIAIPFVTGRFVDRVAAGDPRLAGLMLAFAGSAVGLALTIMGYILLAGRVATGVSHDIRQAAFAKLQELSFSYYDQRPVGWLMSRLTSDCDRLARIIGWSLLDFLWGTVLVGGIAVMMLWLNWRLALAVLAVVPLLALVSIWFQRRLLSSARGVRRANAEITARFNEAIMGIRTTKALVREEGNLLEFQQGTARMYEHSVANLLQSALYLPLVITLGSLAAGTALWYGGGQVAAGAVSIGTLVMFMNYTGLFFDPVQEMAQQFTEVQMAQAAAERIEGLLQTEPAIGDSPAVRAALETQRSRPLPAVAADGGRAQIDCVQFDSVGFAYREGHPVLHDFQLTVRRGESVALVGPTGGGKSTIVGLLCRFYEPTSGRVLIDGVDYRQRSLHWLQSNLGMVLQTPHLFSGSIRENIRYGRLLASDAEVELAARQAGAARFIGQLDEGYEAEVGEGGQRLSTGQRQLVSLARAILADPQLFILDEATSSVDTETERLIQHSIQQLLQGRISFVIAHRLSTVRSVDRILVIEQGRVVESGSHAQLVARRGRYYDLCLHQLQ